ncbi:hypothetical protein FRZ61_23250 [Hypericibacter adhaerens]|uniref:Uncharacterized protein n=1 Tax=Hypericibacter adhaerens TaxID=2602016 RepID=A0A5J6N0D8_9PROT|nr:hypothetical protein FRZ61_23250 [Hypericibacter adhaerens]
MIAFKGPGVPAKGMPSARARGFPEGVASEAGRAVMGDPGTEGLESIRDLKDAAPPRKEKGPFRRVPKGA